MPSKRIFDNRSRQFNERRIDRNLDSWGNGLILDVDSPQKSFEESYNAIDFGTEVRGRKGSLLYNLANYGINVDSSQNWQEALGTGGVLEGAVLGERFIVYNFLDFKDESLITAKSNKSNGKYFLLPYAYDVYQITLDDEGEDLIPSFIGNILIPYHLDLVPLNHYLNGEKVFTAVKSGNEVTITNVSTDFNSIDVIGRYILYGKLSSGQTYFGFRELITDYNSNGSEILEVETSKNEGSYNYCIIQPKIWASYYYSKKEMIFMQCGRKVYYSTVPFYGWKECVSITSFVPAETKSKFELFGSDLILTNENSKYRFEFKDDEILIFSMNTNFEKIKPKNETKVFFGFQSSKANLPGENPYKFAGFSKLTVLKKPDKTGGQWL